MAFPATRLRRLRQTGVLRGLVRETDLAVSHLVFERWDLPAVRWSETPPAATEPARTCPECGAPLAAGATECPACGTELGAPDGAAAATSAAPG